MMMPLLTGNTRGRGRGGMHASQQQVALMAGLMSMAAMMGAGNTMNPRGRGGFNSRGGSRGGRGGHGGPRPGDQSK